MQIFRSILRFRAGSHALFLLVFSLTIQISRSVFAEELNLSGLEPYAVKAWEKFESRAAFDVFAYASDVTRKCTVPVDQVEDCSLASRTYLVKIFGPKFKRDPDHQLVSIVFNLDTGNVWDQDVSLFVKSGKNAYRRTKGVEGIVGQIIRADWRDRKFFVVTETMKDGDSRCCPSGRANWFVDIESGDVTPAGGDHPLTDNNPVPTNSKSPGQQKILSGRWTSEDGELLLDLTTKPPSYSGIDDGCTITSIKSLKRTKWSFVMSCSSDANPQAVKRTVTVAYANGRLSMTDSKGFSALFKRE